MAATNKLQHSPYDYRTSFTVTKSDTVAIALDPANTTGYSCASALQVAASGTLSYLCEDGVTTTWTGTAVGQIIPVNVIRVNLTGSTASVVALIR